MIILLFIASFAKLLYIENYLYILDTLGQRRKKKTLKCSDLRTLGNERRIHWIDKPVFVNYVANESFLGDKSGESVGFSGTKHYVLSLIIDG